MVDTLDTPDTPTLTIRESSTVGLMGVAGRYIGTFGAGFVSLFGFLAHRDLNAFLAWLQGEALIPFLTAGVALVCMGWGALTVVRMKALAIFAAQTKPANVVVVK